MNSTLPLTYKYWIQLTFNYDQRVPLTMTRRYQYVLLTIDGMNSNYWYLNMTRGGVLFINSLLLHLVPIVSGDLTVDYWNVSIYL
jgi:hypothetical protein